MPASEEWILPCPIVTLIFSCTMRFETSHDSSLLLQETMEATTIQRGFSLPNMDLTFPLFEKKSLIEKWSSQDLSLFQHSEMSLL